MYCYTYVNEFSCMFNELQLWSHISSDHPNFLKTVATLSKINLPKEVVDSLDTIHKTFQELYNNVVYLKKTIVGNPNLTNKHAMDVDNLIDSFILHDSKAVYFYPKLMAFGKENMTWKELVTHIINEQAFMLDLFKDLRQQITS